MRKKTVFIMLALWGAFATIAKADNVTIPDITLLAGGTATMSIELNNTEKDYSAFQFYFSLPEGVSVVMENGRMKYELGERLKDTDFSVSTTTTASGNYFVLGYYTVTQPIPEHSGAIITFTLQADEDAATGTVQGQLYDSSFTSTTAEKNVYDCSFNINIVDLVTLEETSTTPPAAANGKNVIVRRTIKAGQWSTIVLPFAITAEQMTTAFGDDVEVQVADFMGYTKEEDENGDIASIRVNFSTVEEMEANRPYIIKVDKQVTEICVDNVDIDPEEEPTNAAVRRTRRQWSEMIGTYVADFTVPESTLFLSDNMFFYSVGQTKMKAFRAYFDFYDVLSSVDDASSKFAMDFDTATGIDGLPFSVTLKGAVYTVGGQLVGKDVDERLLPKGVYIRNGKKFVVK